MTGRRLWRDAPLPEGRIKLGERAIDPTRFDVDVQVKTENSAQAAAHARVAQLESVLDETQHALAALRAELEAERKAAREQGFAAGREQGEAVAQQELRKQLESWRHSVEDMLHANDERWRALHAELTDIVLAAATKLVGEQLASPHGVRACVEHVMRESGITAPSRVLLAPTQYEQLVKHGGAHLAWFKERKVELAPDARVTHGGCILETPGGLIDGRYDVQLGRLRELVAAHYRAGAP